eukprot:symbB.v1.2.036831.t1/scaffold5292.1/size28769/4
MLTRITGKVPSNMAGTFNLKMPQSTLVGQSGPATRIATLSIFNPLCFKICSMARVGTLSTPTNCWTFTDFPMAYPMEYCSVHAIILASEDTITADTIPKAKPTEGSSWD